MRINQEPCPNIYTPQTPNYGSFLDADTLISKKRPIKFVEGWPKIGTARVLSTNFEKKRVELGQVCFYSSIALDKNLDGLSSTELRVEDYYLLRTAPPNSELYRSIPHINSLSDACPIYKALFNPHLPQPKLKCPNAPQSPNQLLKTKTQNQFSEHYQLEGNRLSLLNKNFSQKDLVNSIQNLQQNSFNRNTTQNSAFKQLAQPVHLGNGGNFSGTTQMNFNRFDYNRNALPIFLQFFYKELRKCYENKQQIYPMIENYLSGCFRINQRAQELRRMYLSDFKLSPSQQSTRLCKKYGECLQMKKLIDGFQQEFEKKRLGNQIDPQLFQYVIDILRILQEIYGNQIREVYRYCHNQISQESFKKITQALEQKESTLIFQYNQMPQNNYHYQDNSVEMQPQFQSQMITYDQRQLERFSPTPLHFNKSYNDYESLQREQLQNQIFLMNSLNTQLKCLYERERIEREEHLYDIVNKYEDLGQIDDFVSKRRRRKEAPQVFILIDENPETTKKTAKGGIWQSNRKSNNGERSVKVNQFSAGSIKSKLALSTIDFKVSIFWSGSQKELYKRFSGSFKILSSHQKEQIQAYIQKFLQIRCRTAIREDAKFQFGQLVRREKIRNVFQISATAVQKKINIKPPYTPTIIYPNRSEKGLIANQLTISNNFGEIRWKHSVNIQNLDFMKSNFEISDNQVLCECDNLNSPCEISFFSFPERLLKLEKEYEPAIAFARFGKFISKFPNFKLVSIDWKKRQYTISSEEFYVLSEEDEVESNQEIHKKELFLKELEERLSVSNFNIKEVRVDP